MKKSELKKRILEALTPDEASKVDAKYKEIYAGMVGKNPLKMKKYGNPDKVAYGRAINLIQKESLKLAEIDAMMEDAQEKSKKNYSNYFKKMDKNRLEEFVKEALKNPKKADLDKDGKLSDYEKARATAIEKSIDKVDEAEVNEMKMMDFAKLAKKVKNAQEFIEKVASQLGSQSSEGEKALTSMYNSLKTMEEGLEEAEVKDYTTQVTNQVKMNVKNVSSFAEEILRHINQVAQNEPQGEQMMDNAMKKGAILKLKSAAGSKEETLSERILKELRGSINEMAGEDLELKSLAKKMIPIFKKYGMRVDYKTDTKSIEMKPKVNAGNVPATLIISKQDDDKGGQFGMLTVAVYWLSLVSAKNNKRLGLKELDYVPPSPQTYDIADEMANKIYKELMAVVPKGEFDSIAPPKMNRWGNYLIHFRLKK
jgi:hypothetical protein